MQEAALMLVLVLTAALAGCAERLRASPPDAHPPESVGTSLAPARVYRLDRNPLLRPSAGSEGYVLENGVVRFVISGPAIHDRTTAAGGQIVGAAVCGGEEALRLMAAVLGGEELAFPTYKEVRIDTDAENDGHASVVADGYVVGQASVAVQTVYTLEPGAQALCMATTVSNNGSDALRDFSIGDRVYQGRTERFAEGLGLHLRGRSGPTGWFSFFTEGSVWAVYGSPHSTFMTVNRASSSDLIYWTGRLEPGERQSCVRWLFAGQGDVARLSGRLLSALETETATVSVTVTEKGTGKPVSGARLLVRRRNGSAVTLMRTDAKAQAAAQLIRGSYEIICWEGGRTLVGPLRLNVGRGSAHELHFELTKPAIARVRVLLDEEGLIRPTEARLSVYSSSRYTPSPPLGPPFPTPGPRRFFLVDGTGELVVPLPPPRGDSGSYALVASKGPLYEPALAAVTARAGQAHTVELTLRRVLKPGDYAAVDFRQHGADSLDCALTPQERLMTERCEGLHGAVVNAASAADLPLPELSRAGPALIPGMEVPFAGAGRLGIFPVGHSFNIGRQVLDEAGAGTASLCRTIRRYFPRAIIQMSRLPGVVPDQRELSGGAASFDALQILAGPDVAGARELLPGWFRMLNDGQKVFVTGGSGSGGVQDPLAGVARTYVHCPRLYPFPSTRELTRAVLRLAEVPNAFVSNGPFLDVTVNGKPIGSLQSVMGEEVSMTLHIPALPGIQVNRVLVYRNGELLRELTLSLQESTGGWRHTLALKTPQDCWFVVQAEGDKAIIPLYGGRGEDAVVPFAVTNPFWVDTDGDGAIMVKEGGR